MSFSVHLSSRSRPRDPLSSSPSILSSQPSRAELSIPMNNIPSTPPDLSTPPSAKCPRPQPIALPSEPRQYRAIGLVEGVYQPSEDLGTKGTLRTQDGLEIDAVLLGRILSLLKKHINLQESHLWVVYPRTRQTDEQLHVQITGMWDPELLHPELLTQVNATGTDNSAPIQDGYFSIRGEVIFYAQEEEKVIVRIQQAPRKPTDKPKTFKVHLQGLLLAERVVGHFWDLHVVRQGHNLVIQEAHNIGMIPKKRLLGGRNLQGKGGHQNRFKSQPRNRQKPREQTTTHQEGLSTKPVKRKLF